MKRTLTLVLLLIVLFSASSCLAQETKYVHNDKSVWGDKPQVALEEQLVIGGYDVDDENYLMYDVREAIIDKKGRISVLDTGNNRIQVFSSKGKYRKTIGRAGQGPGEFQAPISFDQSKNGNYIVNNFLGRNFLVLFERSDEQKRIVQPRFVHEVRFLDNGDFIASATTGSRGIEPGFATEPLFTIFSQRGEKLREVLETDPFEKDGSYHKSTGIHFDSDSQFIYYSYDINNIIRKVDIHGNILLEISRKLNYDIEEYGSKVEGNKLYSSNRIARGVAVDGLGRIWVCTFKKQFSGIDMNDRNRLFRSKHAVYKELCVFEIFSPEGSLLGEVPLPMDMFSFRIKDNKLLAVDLDMVSVHVFDIIEKPSN